MTYSCCEDLYTSKYITDFRITDMNMEICVDEEGNAHIDCVLVDYNYNNKYKFQ